MSGHSTSRSCGRHDLPIRGLGHAMRRARARKGGRPHAQSQRDPCLLGRRVSCCVPSWALPIAWPGFEAPVFAATLPAPNAVRPRLVHLPGGRFMMGSDAKEGFAEDGEGPARTVEVSPIAIGETTDTNSDFSEFSEFSEFVRATHYITDVEQAGKSFVCYLQVHPLRRPIAPGRACVCPLRRNGNSQRVGASCRHVIRGEMNSSPVASADATLGRGCSPRSHSQAGRPVRWPRAASMPMAMVFVRWSAMCGSGARTGSVRATTKRLICTIQELMQPAFGGRSEVAPSCAFPRTATATASPHVRPTRRCLPPATAGLV